MVRRFSIHPPAARAGALILVVLIAAMTAISLHRHGHTQGDDFALYLRQARSLFEGDIDEVVADNRFAVLNSNDGFSPNAYPWGWPLLLSPFVHLWGLDYDRLKLIVVGLFCAWLVLLHGIIRRRVGRPIALAVIAVIGTSPAFSVHTDQLLSEFPHLVAVTVVIWWYDRVRERGALVGASTRDLVILGALSTLAFNVRREGVVLVGVIAVIQAVELLGRAVRARGSRTRTLIRSIQTSWRNILVPHATFALCAALFQLLLPTALLPDNGNSREFINNRFGDFPGVLTRQLGIGHHPAIGVAFIGVALIGVVVGVRRRPLTDGALALLAAFTALTISTHFRLVDRYWFQVTPWVLYFAAVAIAAAVRFCVRHRPRLSTSVALVPLLWLIVVHVAVAPGDMADARDFNDAGRVQIGPTHPDFIAIYDAVRQNTPPTAVIAYFRARTMTLLTDRLSFQNTSLDRVRERADYFAQRRGRDYWQPELTTVEARELGFDMVWSDSKWILWKVTPP